MTTIDFPSLPSEGDIVAGGNKVWQYTNGAWLLVKYQAADSGTIDSGSPSSDGTIILNGGNQLSIFSAPKSIDGGGV
jgi:hypothetical protein